MPPISFNQCNFTETTFQQNNFKVKYTKNLFQSVDTYFYTHELRKNYINSWIPCY